MGVPQYLRKFSLIIGDEATGDALELADLRCKFTVRRGDMQTPNSADIRVFNVSDNTAQRVEKEFTKVVLQAGYDGSFGTIFEGTVMQVRRGRESSTDTYLDITAADGDQAYNWAVCNFTLVPGASSPQDEYDAIMKSFEAHGVKKGYAPKLEGNHIPRGKVVFGMARDLMRKFAENMRCSWSIQDGKLELIPLNGYKPGDIPVITQETGMIGMPEQSIDGIKVKALLNPNLRIGQAVKLDNASIQRHRYDLGVKQQAQNALTRESIHLNNDGLYYIMVANHSGDTRGQDWYTNLTCLAIDATVPNSLLARQAIASPVKGPVKPS